MSNEIKNEELREISSKIQKADETLDNIHDQIINIRRTLICQTKSKEKIINSQAHTL